jgi:hypothetical protein
MKKLPNKPSALLRVAIADMKKASRSRLYAIDMGVWHTGKDHWFEREKCVVCLAGSVMAFSLEACRGDDLAPPDFDKHTNNRLTALNWFRMGDVSSPVHLMTKRGISYERHEALRELDTVFELRMRCNDNAENKPKFYRDMLWLADRLEEMKF